MILTTRCCVRSTIRREPTGQTLFHDFAETLSPLTKGWNNGMAITPLDRLFPANTRTGGGRDNHAAARHTPADSLIGFAGRTRVLVAAVAVLIG